MDKGKMLQVLARTEEALPQVLSDRTLWTSLDVDYEPPRVERMWCQRGKYRVFIHRIHPCDKALFHPHPWPSAVKILSGTYEMSIGHGTGASDPPEAATVLLTSGSSYEMIDPNGWHSVRPIGGPSLSLMVTAYPYDRNRRHPGEKRPEETLQTLSVAAET